MQGESLQKMVGSAIIVDVGITHRSIEQMKSYQETRQAVEQAIAQFPSVFGLRGFPNEIFRISKSHSYFNDSNVLMLYTEIKTKGEWHSFSKGTVSQLLMNVVELKMLVAEQAELLKGGAQ